MLHDARPFADTVTAEEAALFWHAPQVAGWGVVVTGVGAIFGALALGQKSTSDQNCPTFDGQLRCNATGSSAMSTAQTFAWVSDFGIGVGAAAVLAGGLLFGFGGAHQEGSPSPSGAPPANGASSWDFHFTTSAHGGQGFLSRSF